MRREDRELHALFARMTSSVRVPSPPASVPGGDAKGRQHVHRPVHAAAAAASVWIVAFVLLLSAALVEHPDRTITAFCHAHDVSSALEKGLETISRVMSKR